MTLVGCQEESDSAQAGSSFQHMGGRMVKASGENGAVQEFFEPIFLTLEVDHRAFLSEAEQRELATGNMEKRLDAAKEMLKKSASATPDG